MKKIIFFVIAACLVLGITDAYALIDSTVVFDIAWSGQMPNDTTYWGTPYQVNGGDLAAYDGMFEYNVVNWNTSIASISRFEVWFPASIYTQRVTIQGTPTGWDLGVNSGPSGAILIWGATTSNPILPGQSLDGFLVDFTTTLPTPNSLVNFVQAYDVYENSNKSGDSGKGTTTPVPEPTSMMLLGMGVLGLFGLRKKT